MGEEDNYYLDKPVGIFRLVGSGTRASPFVLPADIGPRSVLSRLGLFHQSERAMGAEWRVLDWGRHDAGASIERVRLVRRTFTGSTVTTERIAFYFDVSFVQEAEPPPQSPIIWHNGRDLWLPHDLEWLHFDRREVNSDRPVFDGSFYYSSATSTAIVYVYGQVLVGDTEALKREAASVTQAVSLLTPGATDPWGTRTVGPLMGSYFLVGDDITFAGVALRGGKFVKVRLTSPDKSTDSRMVMADCLNELGAVLVGDPDDWTGT